MTIILPLIVIVQFIKVFFVSHSPILFILLYNAKEFLKVFDLNSVMVPLGKVSTLHLTLRVKKIIDRYHKYAVL